MSAERAYKNCMRCYGLAQFLTLPYGVDKDSIGVDNLRNFRKNITHLHDDQVYSAMNEAMKAVSEASIANSHCNESYYDDALSACVTCDFSTPKIADALEDIVKPKI